MNEQPGTFHRQDKIQTPLGEWVFMGIAFLAVLVGLPVLLGMVFEYLLPMLGRAWGG